MFLLLSVTKMSIINSWSLISILSLNGRDDVYQERAEEANAQKAERLWRRRRLGVRAAGQPRPDAPQGPGAPSRRASAVLLRALTEGHWPGPLAALLNGPYPPPPSDTQRKRRLLAPAPRGKAQL